MVFDGIRFGWIFFTIKKSLAQCVGYSCKSRIVCSKGGQNQGKNNTPGKGNKANKAPPPGFGGNKFAGLPTEEIKKNKGRGQGGKKH